MAHINCTATVIDASDYTSGGLEWFSVLRCSCGDCARFTSSEWLVRYGTEYTEDMEKFPVSVEDIDTPNLHYVAGAGAHLFHADREPWSESDPYPDFALDASGEELVLMEA